MKNVYCPHCNHILTAWEGYKVLNLKSLKCPNCKTLLGPAWRLKTKSLWKRRLVVLAWTLPAFVAMTVVWLEPKWWLYLVLSLVGFHVLALAVICVGGFYNVKIRG
jgi:hypothetical protein